MIPLPCLGWDPGQDAGDLLRQQGFQDRKEQRTRRKDRT